MDGQSTTREQKKTSNRTMIGYYEPANSQDYKFLDFNNFNQHILHDIENSTSTLNIYVGLDAFTRLVIFINI
jgi:hypothetical protein